MSDPHKVVGKHIFRGRERVEVGQIIDPSDAELAAFGDRLEPVDDPDDEEDPPPEVGESLPFNPADCTNDEVAENVADVDDEEALRALLNLEQEQKDRDGATEAIQDRLDEVSE